MRDHDIDRLLGQSPCLCGATDTWHQTCFSGKTREQIHADYDRVYAALKKHFGKMRAADRKAALKAMRSGPAPRDDIRGGVKP